MGDDQSSSPASSASAAPRLNGRLKPMPANQTADENLKLKPKIFITDGSAPEASTGP